MMPQVSRILADCERVDSPTRQSGSKQKAAVREDLQSGDGFAVATRTAPVAPRPGAVVIAALLTTLTSAAVCVAAVLAPAPIAALPLVVAVCVGCPMFAAWELAPAIASLRATRARRSASMALAKFQEGLRKLPEVEHPHGF
jgi:hypothetical protein